ncbi:hypothetical protein D8674_000241 [Pyrus ussuriensis x Pyrus communis]|uniref:Uncharacterized protein n=1 Tax=Pyrus ussuriensis x Pyrus communis TaxID=2448454 RepID=A0A5N5F5F3_9ROSA|nr:hypothetical protein D8674_000241 [Pyrus ussuriensis x Pyrus communis]
MQNNCPTAEWCSWKYVPKNVKKAVMDELLSTYTKLNLISNHRAASRGSRTPSPGSSIAAISTPDMGTTGVPLVTPLGPTVSTTLASSTSSVTHPVLNVRQIHR